jgi:hypothetical protein
MKHFILFLCFVDRASIPTLPTDTQLKHNMSQLLYIYSIPPDDGLQICPKHGEVDGRNKLRINSA